MYFELKAFDSGKRTKLQLDSNPPFTNDPSPIIGGPESDYQFDAKRIRALLLHVANELIPRIVASHHKGKGQALESLVKKFAPSMKKGGNADAKETKEFIKEIIRRIESDEKFPIPTTRFNFENQTVEFEQDVRTSVNGEIPPPPRPKR